MFYFKDRGLLSFYLIIETQTLDMMKESRGVASLVARPRFSVFFPSTFM